MNAVTGASCILETALALVALLFMGAASAKRLAVANRADAERTAARGIADRIESVDGAADQLSDAQVPPWRVALRDLKEPLFVERGPVRDSDGLRRVKDHTLS